jgi:hypothetical protein
MINQLNDDDEENIYNLEFQTATTNISNLTVDDFDKLKAYIIRLKNQLEEEKSNSKQAAEYGLSLLEDSKKLQSRIYELEGEIETYKTELETTNLVCVYIFFLKNPFKLLFFYFACLQQTKKQKLIKF